MNITGFLKINSLDKDGKIIDTYEHKNTIMDTGRANVMNLLYGLTDYTAPIGKFVLAEDGYNGGSGPAPIDSSRTNTFGEASGNGYVHEIEFELTSVPNIVQAPLPISRTDVATTTSETGNPTTNSTVTTTTQIAGGAFEITYRFEIPQGNANDGGVKQYNEAALYTKPDASTGNTERIFAMRTFPSRAKDQTISYDISWTISFG